MPRAFEPAYLSILRTSELRERVGIAYQHLEDCDLCARYCHVNRRQTVKGAVCRTGERAVVHSFGPHHGEEDPLRGWRGSGTIFFSWCNLRCIYCQNWEISWKGMGHEVEPEDIAGMMLQLQDRGCHNINFVSRSHVVAQILAAVQIAAEGGLRLPLVYKTGGYDSPEALALLDGGIDIDMPDMKYSDSTIARQYSHVPNYPAVNQAAVKDIHRQAGLFSFPFRSLSLARERVRVRVVHRASTPPAPLLTRVGFLKNSDLASRLAAYCGDLNNPQTQGGKPCFARPLSTNG